VKNNREKPEQEKIVAAAVKLYAQLKNKYELPALESQTRIDGEAAQDVSEIRNQILQVFGSHLPLSPAQKSAIGKLKSIEDVDQIASFVSSLQNAEKITLKLDLQIISKALREIFESTRYEIYEAIGKSDLFGNVVSQSIAMFDILEMEMRKIAKLKTKTRKDAARANLGNYLSSEKRSFAHAG